MPAPDAASKLVPVVLHTRRDGELRWRDRGPAYVPEQATAGRAATLLYDAITYIVEDVFDDGRRTTVWAKALDGGLRRPRMVPRTP